ncbi:transposase [Streptomyces sp. NPDC096012]|uniref:transposase n=1 Tax=Streptomyces sp. NPDC096012 TaxID=3155684 RepID=UPI003369E3F2
MEPLPDPTPKQGGRWRDHRKVIHAIAFKYRTGTPWIGLPEYFGRGKAFTTGYAPGPPTAPGSAF